MESKHELEAVNFGVIPIVNYRGILVEKLVGGYRVLGQTCNTVDEVDLIIQNACSALNESIVTVRNDGSGVIACTNASDTEFLPLPDEKVNSSKDKE